MKLPDPSFTRAVESPDTVVFNSSQHLKPEMWAPQWSDPMQWGQLASWHNSLLSDKYIPNASPKYFWLTPTATSAFCRPLEVEYLSLEHEHNSAQAVQINLNVLISRAKYLKCTHMAMVMLRSNSYLSLLLGIVLPLQGGRGRVTVSVNHSWAWTLLFTVAWGLFLRQGSDPLGKKLCVSCFTTCDFPFTPYLLS